MANITIQNLDGTIAGALTALAALPLIQRRRFLRSGENPYPRHLFKYRNLLSDQSESIQRIRDLIVESKMFLSSPASFNDPFDMSSKIIFGSDVTEIRKRIREIAKRRLGLGGAALERDVSERMHEMVSTNFKTIRDAHEANFAQTGVFSLAKDPKSILMWSHYGGNHGGICLQFNLAKSPTVLPSVIRMNYTLKYPVVDWVHNHQASLDPALRNKFIGWEYEQEYRIVQPGNAGKFTSFEGAAVTGVIFGCKASDNCISVMRELLTERQARGLPKIRLYKAVMHDSEYKLRVFRCRALEVH